MTKARDLANASTALSAVSPTELGYLDGVTSAVQTQMDTKLASATAATTYVANSLADAKGDIFVATADNTLTRLPVGNSGEQIVADSSTSTGLRYQGNFAAGKNKIINGDFRINQRNFTSTSSDAVYMFDRWRTFTNVGGATYSAQTFTPGTAPVAGYEAINFSRCVTTGLSGTATYAVLAQLIEDVRTLAGQTVTVSFWAKAGSGTPSVSSEIILNYGSGGSSREPLAASVKKYAISTSWVRYSFSFTMPSLSGKTIGTGSYVEFYIWFAAGSDFNSRTDSLGLQNNTFDIWGVQVEAGSVATAFQTATGTLQGELDACKRYTQNINYSLSGKSAYNTVANGSATGATSARITLYLPAPMRVAPTSVTFTASAFILDNVSTAPTVTGVTINQGGTDTVLLTVDASAGTLTNKDPVIMYANNNAAANLILSAEL